MVRLPHLVATVAVVLLIKFLPLLWTIPAAIVLLYVAATFPWAARTLNQHPKAARALRLMRLQSTLLIRWSTQRARRILLPDRPQRTPRIATVERITLLRKAA